VSDPYLKARATALRLIKKKGMPVTLYRVAGGYDPVNPDQTQLAVLLQTSGFAIALNLTSTAARAFTEADNSLKNLLYAKAWRYIVLAGSGLTFFPQPDDVILLSEGPFRILGTIPLSPDGGDPITIDLACTRDVQIQLP
jgi:hypothetical protein